LIRELLKEARSDFPHLSIPDFPAISQQVKQFQHLKRNDWDRLMGKIVKLSGGVARADLTLQQYKALEWKAANRLNQRNWIDLYDTLNLMWFFYLRAEDLPRLRAECSRTTAKRSSVSRIRPKETDLSNARPTTALMRLPTGGV
jgi:hypothetical protein